MRLVPSLALAALMSLAACVGGTSSAGDPGGGGGAGPGSSGTGAASGDFPEAQWTTTLPTGPRTFAAIDEQHFTLTGVSNGHLRLLDAVGATRFERTVSQIGCVGRGPSGGSAAVLDDALEFIDEAGVTSWSEPAEQPCQLSVGSDRVALGEAGGIRVFSSNGQALAGPVAVDIGAFAASSWRRMLDVDGVVAYGNTHTVGALTLDGEPLFELDLPDLEVHAIAASGTEAIAAVSFSADANLCGQTVSTAVGNTRAALVSFTPAGQCAWSYVMLNQGAAPQSTVVRDLAVAGDSLWASGDVSGSLSWGSDSFASGTFLIELSLSNITPVRGTDAVAVNAIDATSDGRVLVVAGNDVSLLYP